MTTGPLTREHRLVAIGEALERAVADELRRSPGRQGVLVRARWRPRRRAVLLAIAALIVIPGAAVAATQLLWNDSQVAASLPQGTLALAGTHPNCTVVVANVEYRCTLAKRPSTVQATGSDRSSPRAGERPHPADELALKLAKRAERSGARIVVSDGGLLVIEHRRLFHILLPGDSAAVRPIPTQSTDWRGSLEATVDSSKHVNGGCRGLNSAGTEWECYIGEAAVEQGIISHAFLGQYAPVPGVG